MKGLSAKLEAYWDRYVAAFWKVDLLTELWLTSVTELLEKFPVSLGRGWACPAGSCSPVSGSGIMHLVLPSCKKHQPRTNKIIPPQSQSHARLQLIVFQPVPQLAALFPLVRAWALRCSLCVSSSTLWLHRSFPRKCLVPSWPSIFLSSFVCLLWWKRPVAQPSGLTLLSRQEMGKSENIFSLLSQGSSCALTFSLQWLRMMWGSGCWRGKAPGGICCMLECLKLFWVGKLIIFHHFSERCLHFFACLTAA